MSSKKLVELIALTWVGIVVADMCMHPEYYRTEEEAEKRTQLLFDTMAGMP